MFDKPILTDRVVFAAVATTVETVSKGWMTDINGYIRVGAYDGWILVARSARDIWADGSEYVVWYFDIDAEGRAGLSCGYYTASLEEAKAYFKTIVDKHC